MEKISTPRAALLPRAANLATLAVVVAATWWSGAQRPVGQAMLATADTPPATTTADASVQRQPAMLTATAAATSTGAAIAATTWPAQAATSIAREGLQAVSYQARTHR